MWRNIFGHGIYQIIALVVIIFTAEGWFVQDYSTSCLKYAPHGEDTPKDQLKCSEWNPFYASSLYQDSLTQTWWSHKNLTSSDFNAALLDLYSCDIYVQEHPDEFKKEPNCTEVMKDRSRVTLPADAELGTMTQKLLHYTMVFQMFVFMQLFNQINARKIEEGELNVFKGFFNNFLFLFVTILTFVVQMAMVEIGGKAIKTWPLNTDQNIICLIFGSIELIWGLIIKFIPTKFFTCVSMDDAPAGEEKDNTMVSRLKATSKLTKGAKMGSQLGNHLVDQVRARQLELEK